MFDRRIPVMSVVAVLALAQPPATEAQQGLSIVPPPARQLTPRPGTAPSPGQEGNRFLTPQQEAQLDELAKQVDAQVMAGFRGREALKARMESELQNIAKIEDSLQRNQAIAAFQARYANDYRKVLADGGVNLGRVARTLEAILPGTTWTVVADTHLIAIDAPPAQPQTSPPPPPVPASTRQTVTGRQMTQTGSGYGCSGYGSGRVDTSSATSQTTRLSLVYGWCSYRGNMSFKIERPQGMRIRISGVMSLAVEASTVSINSSSSAGAAVIFGQKDTLDRQFFAYDDGARHVVLRTHVWSALIWAASNSRSMPRHTIQPGQYLRPFRPSGDAYIVAETEAYGRNIGMNGSATAVASIRDINLTVSLDPIVQGDYPPGYTMPL